MFVFNFGSCLLLWHVFVHRFTMILEACIQCGVELIGQPVNEAKWLKTEVQVWKFNWPKTSQG